MRIGNSCGCSVADGVFPQGRYGPQLIDDQVGAPEPVALATCSCEKITILEVRVLHHAAQSRSSKTSTNCCFRAFNLPMRQQCSPPCHKNQKCFA
jgi:hypothetical protein